jgi:hypothetical protein
MPSIEIEYQRFLVKKAGKGRLVTAHSNPRQTVVRNYVKEFNEALGGSDKGEEMVHRFQRLNEGSVADSMMSDGIIYTLIHQYSLGRVILQQVLGIGTGRYLRVREGSAKNIDYKHLNGLQVRSNTYNLTPRMSSNILS